MSFTDLVAGIDDAVEAHLCDPALYRTPGGEVVEICAVLERPVENEAIQQVSWARGRPVVRFRAIRIARPRKGDLVQFGAMPWNDARETWALAAAPEAPDDGGWWLCDVEPG